MEDINTMTATLVLLLFLAERVRERDGCMPCGFRDRMAAEQPREYNSAGGANSTPPERRVDTIGTPVYRERVGPLVAIHTLETKTT